MAEECSVLPGLFGYLVQGALFVAVCGVLVFKKLSEKKGRTWFEFLLDSSKQMAGAGWIHVMNLFFATKLDAWLPKGDQCEWYWINIVVDTTLGVAVEYALLQGILALVDMVLKPEEAQEYKPGLYFLDDGKFALSKYVKQLVVWLLVVTGMKFSMVLLMCVAAQPLEIAAAWVLSPLWQDPKLKLLAVMIVTPMCMNALQFWIVDNFIKKHEEQLESGKDTHNGYHQQANSDHD